MSHFFKTNETIKKVERIGNVDRYGQKLSNVLSGSSGKRVRFERKTSSSISPDGRQSRVDGTMMVSGLVLEEQDTVTFISDNSVWTVFSTDDTLDINGRVLFRTHRMVKKR